MQQNNTCCTKEITLPKCCDLISEEICLPVADTGKILAINLTLKHVLANKKISIGIFVFEGKVLKGLNVRTLNTGGYDDCGEKEDSECFQYLTYKNQCKYKDINSGNFYFVFPGENECENEKLSIKIVSHYTDINM